MEYFLVGGGGAGGPGACRCALGGGGGGGGVATGTFTATASNYTVVVGNGGQYNSNNQPSTNGLPSSIAGTGVSATATGGGAGGCNYYSPNYLDGCTGGGGGGGGSADDYYTYSGGRGGVGTLSRGANAVYNNQNDFYSGGGGGAGGPASGANGGIGAFYGLTNQYYGGGGAGARFLGNTLYPNWYSFYIGGTGGGANSGPYINMAGANNTGGGGAGGDDPKLPYYSYYPTYIQSYPGNGGSGVAVVAYQIVIPPASPITYLEQGSANGGFYITSANNGKIGGSSMYMASNVGDSPSTDYMTATGFPASTKLTGSWTIEFFYFVSSAVYVRAPCFAAGDNVGVYLNWWHFNNMSASAGTTGYIGTNILSQTQTQVKNAWNHAAFCFDHTANTYFLAWNGNIYQTRVQTTNIGSKLSSFWFGTYRGSGNYSYGANGTLFNGLRISITPRYTANGYTVPTSYPVDSSTLYINTFNGTQGSRNFTTGETYYNITNVSSPTRFAANGAAVISTTQYYQGSSSLYLPGNGGNRLLMTGFPAATRLNSTSWTVEWFMFLPTGWTASGNAGGPFSAGSDTGSYMFHQIADGAQKGINWYLASTTQNTWDIANNYYNANAITNTWTHAAICYTNATKYEIFFNGTRWFSSSAITTNMGTKLTNFTFGSYLQSGGTYNTAIGGYGMYLDAMRISNTAIYSGATYTPPDATNGYTVDANTIYINYFTGANNTTIFNSGEYYY